MIDVVVAGHLCVDIIPVIADEATAASESFLAPGRLTEVGPAVLSPGGAVSNTGLSLLRLGIDVRLVARIGDDAIGRLTCDILASHGQQATQHLAIASGEPSSYTLVIDPPGIDRTFLHYPGTNQTFGREDVPTSLLGQARLFHFGYPPIMRRMYADGGHELRCLFQGAKAQRATTSLDMSMPDPSQPSGRADWRAILALTLPYADLFMPSVEEMLYMLWPERYDQLRRAVGEVRMIDVLEPAEIQHLSQEALALGAKIVGLKLGHRGLYLRTARQLGDLGRGAPAQPGLWAGRELWVPCFRVKVVGTVGAGDATIAGFLAGLLRGQGPEGAVVSAVAAGACSVEAADATSGVRPWQETQARVARGWARLDARVAGAGWVWDQARAVWRGPNDARSRADGPARTGNAPPATPGKRA